MKKTLPFMLLIGLTMLFLEGCMNSAYNGGDEVRYDNRGEATREQAQAAVNARNATLGSSAVRYDYPVIDRPNL